MYVCLGDPGDPVSVLIVICDIKHSSLRLIFFLHKHESQWQNMSRLLIKESMF